MEKAPPIYIKRPSAGGNVGVAAVNTEVALISVEAMQPEATKSCAGSTDKHVHVISVGYLDHLDECDSLLDFHLCVR